MTAPDPTKGVVVKVQVPIAGTGAAHFLIYAEGRSFTAMQAQDAATLQALDGDIKGYFNARWDTARLHWIIGERVADEDW